MLPPAQMGTVNASICASANAEQVLCLCISVCIGLDGVEGKTKPNAQCRDITRGEEASYWGAKVLAPISVTSDDMGSTCIQSIVISSSRSRAARSTETQSTLTSATTASALH